VGTPFENGIADVTGCSQIGVLPFSASTHNPDFLKVLHFVRLKVALFQNVNLSKTFHNNKEA
jgi:hypothetical protein